MAPLRYGSTHSGFEGGPMPQEQFEVDVEMMDGSVLTAAATGNNAAWRCPCPCDQFLIGRSGQVAGPSDKMIVACPKCKKRYFVHPKGGNFKRVLKVEEFPES